MKPAHLLTALAVPLLLASCAPDDGLFHFDEQQIIDGTASKEGYMPQVGALVVTSIMGYSSFCSATLISKRHVLTAAHCFDELPPGTPYGFYAGSNTRSQAAPADTAAAHAKYIHSSYRKKKTPPTDLSLWYDIAIVVLARNYTKVTPMMIVTPKQVKKALAVGNKVHLVGYGLTNSTDKSSGGTKQHGDSSIARVGSGEIWINGSGDPHKCFGDSGGPTLVNMGTSSAPDWRIIGVASRTGQGCTNGSVETRVDSYLDWILKWAASIPCDSGKKDCTKPPPPPKKKFGEACTAPEDCASNLCIPDDTGGSFCSKYCTTDKNCADGYACTPIAGSTKKACAVEKPEPPPPPPPIKKELGDPCEHHDDCKSGLCGERDGKNFCTRLCTTNDDCGTLDCLPAGGGQSACAPGGGSGTQAADGAGGCSLGAGPGQGSAGIPLLLMLLLAVVAWRPRKHRR